MLHSNVREDAQHIYQLSLHTTDMLLLVKEILEQAYDYNASDIHIDPFNNSFIIRLRIDGLLHHVYYGDSEIITEIIGRLKILAGLRIDVHDRAQDGRFFYYIHEKRIDIRISIVPTYYGENAVIRILDQQRVALNFETLGFSNKDISLLKTILLKPTGLILVCGPTGSGKTTTLYTLLHSVLSEHLSIISLEDPIEYAIDGVRQIHVRHERNFSFTTALKGILRQDPDIIMIGEIRDKETAYVAIQTALTGHMIFSSIHAPDAISVIPRLMDMGIDSYLLAATVSIVISQRLIRKCSRNGFEGRIGIYEILNINDAVKDSIVHFKSNTQLLETAKSQGMITMFEDGINKVKNNITTIEELQRVLYE